MATDKPIISILPNGFRVVSRDLKQARANVCLTVAAGTRYEEEATAGVSQLLARMTADDFNRRNQEMVEQGGPGKGFKFKCSSDREILSYMARGPRSRVPEMIEVISVTSLSNELFDYPEGSLEWENAWDEVDMHVGEIKENITKISQDVDYVLMEHLHFVAFRENGLGIPLVPRDVKLDQISPKSVRTFYGHTHVPQQMVLSALNVNHDALVKEAKKAFGFLSTSLCPTFRPAIYTSGVYRVASTGPPHVLLAFEGVRKYEEHFAAAVCLESLFGTDVGNSERDGMKTIAQKVLNEHKWLTFIRAFNLSYNESGLFGIHARCEDPKLVNKLAEVVGSEFARLDRCLSKSELYAARSKAKAKLIDKFDNERILCSDMGEQLLCNNYYVSPKKIIEQVEAVDAESILSFVNTIMTTPPTIIVCGDKEETYVFAALARFIMYRQKPLSNLDVNAPRCNRRRNDQGL